MQPLGPFQLRGHLGKSSKDGVKKWLGNALLQDGKQHIFVSEPMRRLGRKPTTSTEAINIPWCVCIVWRHVLTRIGCLRCVTKTCTALQPIGWLPSVSYLNLVNFWWYIWGLSRHTLHHNAFWLHDLVRLWWLSERRWCTITLACGGGLALQNSMSRPNACGVLGNMPWSLSINNGLLDEKQLFWDRSNQGKVVTILCPAEMRLSKRKDPQHSSVSCQLFFGFFGGYTSDPIFQPIFVQSRIQLSRIQLTFKRFTPSNTGLDSQKKYPELASTFKAAFVKSALWFYAKMALKICEDHPAETQLKSWTFCFFISKCNVLKLAVSNKLIQKETGEIQNIE